MSSVLKKADKLNLSLSLFLIFFFFSLWQMIIFFTMVYQALMGADEEL